MNLVHSIVNPLTPNDPYRGRTAPLTSKVAFYIFIQQIQVLNILNMVYTLSFFPLENAASLIFLTYLVPVLLTFYIQDVPKLKKNSGAKRLIQKNNKLRVVKHFGYKSLTFRRLMSTIVDVPHR